MGNRCAMDMFNMKPKSKPWKLSKTMERLWRNLWFTLSFSNQKIPESSLTRRQTSILRISQKSPQLTRKILKKKSVKFLVNMVKSQVQLWNWMSEQMAILLLSTLKLTRKLLRPLILCKKKILLISVRTFMWIGLKLNMKG